MYRGAPVFGPRSVVVFLLGKGTTESPLFVDSYQRRSVMRYEILVRVRKGGPYYDDEHTTYEVVKRYVRYPGPVICAFHNLKSAKTWIKENET